MILKSNDQYCIITQKHRYEICSNSLTVAGLSGIILAIGYKVTGHYINRNGCSVVKFKTS